MRIFGFAGFSGSGKTTLIEKLVPLLLRTAVRIAAPPLRVVGPQSGRAAW